MAFGCQGGRQLAIFVSARPANFSSSHSIPFLPFYFGRGGSRDQCIYDVTILKVFQQRKDDFSRVELEMRGLANGVKGFARLSTKQDCGRRAGSRHEEDVGNRKGESDI